MPGLGITSKYFALFEFNIETQSRTKWVRLLFVLGHTI